ncbi:hypothetical protein PRK78_004987 [Emydomyces testavorans]|uniref:Polysaccharide biosynthesis domain-containing protein n=1 Tax=Emydomyces testavorans TaxID=2070801 RepID=A0AAF0DJT1_9EURO|nr:hypothetical protein PRK78_004987 [Emydomyces testavorans]
MIRVRAALRIGLTYRSEGQLDEGPDSGQSLFSGFELEALVKALQKSHQFQSKVISFKRARMSQIPAPPGFDPEKAENLEDIEKQFAVKAVQQMSTYWAILEKTPGSKLRLTKLDDEIYEHFKREFPDFDVKGTIDEEQMKSKEGKEKWRNFMMEYEKKISDYNFGTLLRKNAKWEYGEKETMFAVRMQNREGLNDWIYEESQKGA